MSKRDDDIAGSTPSPRPNKQPSHRRRVITGSGAAVAGAASVAGVGTVLAHTPATLTITGRLITLRVERPQRPVDPVSQFVDRWLKLLLFPDFYRVVEQVIADWQHEYAEANGKLGLWKTLKNAAHVLWVVLRPLVKVFFFYLDS